MTIRRTAAVAATILLLAACGDEPARTGQKERNAHLLAASEADAAFDKELGGGAAQKPATAPAKPAQPKPEVRPTPPKAAENATPPAPAVEKGRPAWVDQPPSESGKLFAVGGAPRGQRDAARAKAKAEIASQLSVNIAATTSSVEEEITKIGHDGTRIGQAWGSFKSEARATVSRNLTFTTIISEAEDGKECWSLARLDRAEWAAALAKSITEVDTRITAVRDQAAAAGTGLRPAAKALKAICPLIAQREVLVNDLTLADPSGKTPACPVDVPAFLAACAKQLANVSIRLEGSEDAVFTARIQDAMAKLGLSVTEGKSANVVLRLALRETAREIPDNKWWRINVAGSATVVDPATSAIAGSLQINQNGTNLDKNTARSTMLDNAAGALATQVNTQLIDLLAQ